MNLCLMADAYTISGEIISSQTARDKSIYNFTNRKSPAQTWPGLAKDSRMVFFGLSHFIENYLSKPVTLDDVEQADEFMKTAGGLNTPLYFPKHLWLDVVNKYNGFLPLHIEAIPEGSVFYPNEPVIQVTSLDKGYGELAAHIEAGMVGMVSTATARLTLERHLLERMTEQVMLDNPLEIKEICREKARWLIHDFGMRASSCPEESELYGLCHLLCFNGTDTFNAAFKARQLGLPSPIGTSILALAHRIVQGHNTEDDAFNELSLMSNIGSYVADCYNYEEALKNLCQRAINSPQNIFVVRPDSGHYLDCVIKFIQEILKHEQLFKTNAKGFKIPTNIKLICGDSMNYEKICNVFHCFRQMGFSATDWCVTGIGGWLRNTPNRDSLSSAYKLCAKGMDFEPVIKLSEIPEKMSVPGPTKLIRHKIKTVEMKNSKEDLSNGILCEYYNSIWKDYPGLQNLNLPDMPTVLNRVINHFDDDFRDPKYGLERSCLNPHIVKMQDEVYDKYRKVIEV